MTQRLFDFSALFPRWAEPVIRIPKGTVIRDYSAGGRAQKTQGWPEEIMAIVMQLSESDLRTDTGGMYRRDDRKIYVQTPVVLQLDDHVQHKGTKYRIMSAADYTERAGFGRYIMRHSAAGEGDPYA